MNIILAMVGLWALVVPGPVASSGRTEVKDLSLSSDRGRPEAEDLLKKMTPVLYVEAIEPCLRFWVDSLGFAKTAEVPEGDKLGFVILASKDTEVMLQSYASLDKDIPKLGKEMRGAPSVLYVEVSDIGEIERRLEDFPIIVPRRKTFYGATEIFYRSPGGHIIGFAQQNPD